MKTEEITKTADNEILQELRYKLINPEFFKIKMIYGKT